MVEEKRTGNQALMLRGELSTQVIGDGTSPASDLKVDTFYRVDAIAASGSVIPSQFGVKNVFRTPKTGALTLVTGDIATEVPEDIVCRVDISNSVAIGNIDLTDSCSEGNEYEEDGFPDLSGSVNTYLRIDPVTGIAETPEEFILRSFPKFEDNGAGVYVRKDRKGTPVIFLVEKNKEAVVGEKKLYFMFSALITGITFDDPMKGPQNLDITYVNGSSIKAAWYELELL